MLFRSFVIPAISTALLAFAVPAHAQVRITEVAPWGNNGTPYGVDWFELTNIGRTSVNITGWKMDDNSNSFASAVALTGIANIAAGESVVFIESSSAVRVQSFLNTWFGSKVPANLHVGRYSGASVELSNSGDAVNIFNNSGVLQAKVTFGASAHLATFDNAAALNNSRISALSVVGSHGAFLAANDICEIGSPGRIGALSVTDLPPVPEPSTWALMLAGLGLVGAVTGKHRRQ